MKYKTLILVLLFLTLSLATAYAGDGRRVGTAGAQELTIPVGSRGTALGGANTATTKGVEAMFWNPAGVSSIEGTEVMFTHQPYLADIDVNFLGVVTNIEGFGSMGLSAKVVSIGDIEETTEEFPDGTGSVYSPTLSVIGLTFSRVMSANVQFGVTAMVINENIFEVTATGVAFDAGFIYDPRWKGVTLGIAIKNYGPKMKFSGQGFQRQGDGRQLAPNNSSFELPSSINIGLGYNFLNQNGNSVTLNGNLRSNNFSEDYFQGGVEYSYNDRYFLRAGYNHSDQDNYLYGFAFGGGLNVPIGSTNLGLEYSWNETEVFDDNQFFTLKVTF